MSLIQRSIFRLDSNGNHFTLAAGGSGVFGPLRQISIGRVLTYLVQKGPQSIDQRMFGTNFD